MSKLLLVGGTGFVGSHMASYCSPKYSVTASGREVDVCNLDQLNSFISNLNPDFVVHLAAITSVKESIENPEITKSINFGGTLNLLKSLRACSFKGHFLYVSSSEVYGSLEGNDLPVSETKIINPLNPYAESKVSAELLCHEWSKTEDFKITIARPFNHIGPGQSERFAIANFGCQVAKIKLGLTEPTLLVGNIDTTRDFTDVRDIVSAYDRLLNHGRNGEIYNICSGIEKSISSIINKMCELAEVEVEIKTDKSRARIIEQKRVRGDNTKIITETDWSKTYSIDDTLLDIVKYFIKRLS